MGSVVGAHGLVVWGRVGSSHTGDQTLTPCIGRWVLNPWATRGVPSLASFVFALYHLFFYFLIFSSRVALFPHQILNEKEHNFSITEGKQYMADMAGVLSICSYLSLYTTALTFHCPDPDCISQCDL